MMEEVLKVIREEKAHLENLINELTNKELTDLLVFEQYDKIIIAEDAVVACIKLQLQAKLDHPEMFLNIKVTPILEY